MTLILSGTNGVSDIDGDASTPAIRGTDANTGMFFGADIVGLSTGGSERMRIDSSGNVGIGVTPSAWGTGLGLVALDIGGAGTVLGTGATVVSGANCYFDGSNWKYKTSTWANRYEQNNGNTGVHAWFTAPSGTAGNNITFTQAMTLDSSGKLLTNGASSTYGAAGSLSLNGGSGSFVDVELRVGDTLYGYLYTSGADVQLASATSIPLRFFTNNSERARITSGGYFKASNSGSYGDASGTYHEIVQTGNNTVLNTRNTYNWGATVGNYGINLAYTAHSPNNTNSTFAVYSDSTADRAIIYSNGTFGSATSTYGGISDIKLKQDIVDANSQWDDIKGLRIRKYRFKNDVATDPNCPAHLGLIAQEAELVSPGLVFESPDYEEVTRTREVEKTRVVTEAVLDEDGNEIEPAVTETYTEEEEYTEREPTGTVTKSVKYSILYMKAVKALQEAMERIETLEAKVAALEAK